MARVRPFAAWRYASATTDITPLTAPPYDVISDDQREALLACDPHNVVGLELPAGPLDVHEPGNRYETGAETWDAWRRDGIIERDPEPAVYVLEQRYRHGDREVRRRAFIVEVELEPFEAGVVLPHERTLPKALGDRFELIKATGANLSQVFGLFDDPACLTTPLFEKAMASDPIARATDADGVESVLWAATDPAIGEALSAQLADGQIYIADGHHRYTTALAYRDLSRRLAAEAGESPQDPPYDHVMMALVNMDDPDLVVMSTHRVADAPAGLDPVAFKEALAEHFSLEALAPGHPAAALDDSDVPVFLVRIKGEDAPFVARLKPETDLSRAITVPRSDDWKSLDVAVLQELVLDPLLDIHPDRPETLERLTFVKDAHAALKMAGEHDVAFVLRPTRMDQLRAVALNGETMPQKSTYFYPKLLSGLVFRSAR